MRELTEALAALLKRLVNAFDVFDLSFLVSGALSLGAVATLLHQMNIGFWSSLKSAVTETAGNGWFLVVLVLLTYIMGLVSFACGRFIRYRRGNKLKAESGGPRASGQRDDALTEVLKGHGLHSESITNGYLARENSKWHLYTRMWAKLRETQNLSASFNLCNRFWVLSAIYDGMAFAGLLWMIVVIHRYWKRSPGPPYWRGFAHWEDARTVGLGAALIGLVVFALVCLRESERLSKNQLEEMVATLALLPAAERLVWVPSLSKPMETNELMGLATPPSKDETPLPPGGVPEVPPQPPEVF